MAKREQRIGWGEPRRIVVKIGSRVLVQRTGRPDVRRMRELVRQLADLRAEGRQVIVVSSGAVASGMEALGWRQRPKEVAGLQMCAAVGQSRLMAAYDQLFGARGCRIGQILLTHDDLKNRERHLNAHTTMMSLLEHGIIPIVNENDVVAVEEIKFGDNDLLASLVALLVGADALILLTTVDGLRAPAAAGRTRRVPRLEGVSAESLGLAHGKGSELSTGGMLSKLQSAGMVATSGIPVIIADGRKPGVILDAVAGRDVGTLILAGAQVPAGLQSARKRWLAFFHKTPGSVVVDDGARDALLCRGRSLLPIGVKAVEGVFEAGAVVNIKTLAGDVVARGQVACRSADLSRMMGRKTAEVRALLGDGAPDEVIHRDNLVVLAGPAEPGGADAGD